MEKPEWTFWPNQYFVQGFPGGSDGKASACNVGDLGWDDPLEEGMATHSSILAWRIPWTEEPGGLQSIGSQRVRHDWSDLAHMHVVCHCAEGARRFCLHIDPALMSVAWSWAKHPSSTKDIPTEVCHSGTSQSISRLVIHSRHGFQKCCRVQPAFHCH